MHRSLQGIIFICLICFSVVVRAEVIKDIQIIGNQRIEKASILDKISSQPGNSFSQEKITEDVKSLFGTGFFYDIKVDWTSPSLKFFVIEKPIVEKITYEGNTEFNDKDIKETTNINVNEILDIKKVNEAITELKKKYEEKGYFLIEIDYKIKRGKITELVFDIKEGDKVKVKKVYLVGNKSIPDSKIKALMANREKGLLGMGGSFNQDGLKRDQEVIGYIFRNEGFAQVKVGNPVVELTKDKRGISITYDIQEGFKYKVGEIKFSGDVDFTEEELLKGTKLDDSEYFSQATILEDISTVQAKYGDEGYAYANVVPRPSFNDDEKIVNLDFGITKGEKVSLGEINVKGNTNTRDKVVRRELRIFEGELYNETEKRKSLANIRRLGFFDNVEFQQKVSSKGSDVMDLDVQVEERSTGQLNIGAGYGGFQGFTLQGSVQQANFLGKGINFGINVNYSERYQKMFNLSITDPYFNDTQWTLGFNAYQSYRIPIDYEDKTTGAAITIGRRFGDYFSTSLKYTFEKVDVSLTSSAYRSVYTPERVEASNGFASGVTLSAAYDKRNDRQFPSDGYYGRLSLEQTGIGGDIQYTRASANARFYQPIFGSLIWRNNLEYGYVDSPGEVPFNQLYRLGGPYNVRGYDFFNIAQRVSIAPEEVGLPTMPYWNLGLVPYGGTQQFYYNLEFEWDLVKEAKIKGVLFIDVGSANDTIDLGDVKSAYGFGVRWHSPMGPLRFEWGFPFSPDPKLGEQDSNFQFSIMQTF